MDKTDKLILLWYTKGFRDEIHGYSSVVPNDPLISKAYNIGANHAELGDDNRSFDYLSNHEILEQIRGDNEPHNIRGKQIKTENPFTSISVSVTDVMIDTLSNDSELGAYVRGLLNRTR